MRDYVLNRAIASEDFGFSLARLWRNWRSRRKLAKLPESDNYLLRDMGIERSDIDWAMQLPLTRNPYFAMEERSLRRRRAQL